MAQFKPYESGIEVAGYIIISMIEDGMGIFKNRGYEILSNHGITDVKPDGWYSQENLLDALKETYTEIGPMTLKQLSKNKKCPPFPSNIKTLKEAFEFAEISYHMSHRKNGKPMYNPETGVKEEGIGHYSFEITGDRTAKIVCDSPYPCIFDLASANVILKKFKPADSFSVTVEHDKSAPCRDKGGDSCTLLISW